MSIAGEGVYIHLLCYCWREGSIPADRSAIALLCKGYNGRGIDEALSCFAKSKKSERLINKRIELERKRQGIFRKLKQAAGLRGAQSRWQAHGTAILLPMAKNGSSSSSSSSILTPLPPLRKGGRKYQRRISGSNLDPAYGEAYKNKKAKEGKPCEE
jgi:hypothetical protein